MPIIGNTAQPAPTLDYQQTSFDVTEELILLGQEHGFVRKGDQIIGIICLDNLLEEFKSDDISTTQVTEFMEPLFIVKEYDTQLKGMALMLANDVEHIAVTNEADDFIGIASVDQLNKEFH